MVTAREIIDGITAGTRAEKEELAQELRDNNILLRQTLATQATTESDARRATAKAFITNTIEPQLTTPTGNFAARHAQFLANFTVLEDAISNAADGETADELTKRLETERTAFNTLRQDKAAGRIS